MAIRKTRRKYIPYLELNERQREEVLRSYAFYRCGSLTPTQKATWLVGFKFKKVPGSRSWWQIRRDPNYWR